MSDVLDAIARIRLEFKKVGLEAPTAIFLGSNDQGYRFLSSVRQEHRWQAFAGSPDLGKSVQMADGSIWMEVKIMDIAVRWPANKLATPDGQIHFV